MKTIYVPWTVWSTHSFHSFRSAYAFCFVYVFVCFFFSFTNFLLSKRNIFWLLLVNSMRGHNLSNYYLELNRRVDYCNRMKRFPCNRFLELHSAITDKIQLAISARDKKKMGVKRWFTLKSSIRPNSFAVRLYWSLVLYWIRTEPLVLTMPRLISSNVTTGHE